MADKGVEEGTAPKMNVNTSAGAERKAEEAAPTMLDDEDHSDVEEVYMAHEVEQMDMGRVIRKSTMRTKQITRWNMEIHFRLRKLEQDFQKLSGEEILHGGDYSAKGPNHEACIKILSWDEFRPPRALIHPVDTPSEKHSLRLDTRKRWVLEVLERESEQAERKETAKASPQATVEHDIEGMSQQHEHTSSSGVYSKAPARLRIRSRPILTHLNDISKDELNLKPGKMVFLRPFKFFCMYEDEIRARYADLEARFGHELDSRGSERISDKDSTKPEASNLNASKGSLNSSEVNQGEKWSIRALEHFRLLIKFMDDNLKPLFDFRRALGRKEVTKITFQELWHLFKHDQEVYVPGEKESPGIYRVYKFTGGRQIFRSQYAAPSHPFSKDLGPGSWSRAFGIQCWSLKFDGTVYRPQLKTFGIRPYEGEKDITSLPIYPLEHHATHEETRKLCEDSGKLFMKFCQKDPLYMRYTGRNQEEDSKSEQINSEVIVDFEQAYVDRITRPIAIDFDDDVIMHDYREVDEIVPGNTHCKEDGCCTSDLIHCDYDIDNDLREKHYKHGYDSPMLEARSEIETDKDRRLLPSQVHGFVLKKRKWATLSTAPSSLKEVESLNFWKDLVLDSTTKDLVEAQVMQHLQKAEDEKKEGSGANLGEFISGKGRSLVILLHGPPGVGKTSTAECIADHVKKPLYSLTSGNLGVDPDTIEQKLENHFNLAAKWGCILLLDEADVFLQQRKHTNLNINAIVSVFLRQLEYYSGVLFLTTNRLGDIDRAFKSRIHVALEYKRFNKRTTWKVYKLCLDRLQTQYNSRNRDLDIKYDAIRDWAKKHFLDNRWNGREIFNACQTAIALAEWDVKKGERKKLALKVKHFDKVAEASRGFEKYLNDLRDEEANEAWRARTRIDDENLRGRVPQGSLNLLGTPTPSAKKPSRKAASDDDDDDDDDSDIGKKGGKKAKKQRDKSDDDSSDSD